MNPVWKIRALAIMLLVFFGPGTALAIYALFAVGPLASLFLSVAINLAFVVGAIGLMMIKRWAWWLTLALCAISVIQLLVTLFTTLTPDTATKSNEIISYIIAGFYLCIAFVLTSGSVRKTFKASGQTA
jgi:hypothetical protein